MTKRSVNDKRIVTSDDDPICEVCGRRVSTAYCPRCGWAPDERGEAMQSWLAAGQPGR